MPNEINPKDPRNLWQSQEGDNLTISLDEIRLRATRFERRIWWKGSESETMADIIPTSGERRDAGVTCPPDES